MGSCSWVDCGLIQLRCDQWYESGAAITPGDMGQPLLKRVTASDESNGCRPKGELKAEQSRAAGVVAQNAKLRRMKSLNRTLAITGRLRLP